MFPASHIAQRDERDAAGAIAITHIQFVRDFMNNEIETRSIERVLDIQPVQNDGPLLPALPRLYDTLAVHQTYVI